MSDKNREQEIFQAIADPTRRQIIGILAETEMPITAIVDRFPITRTAINKHLHVLAGAGLLKSRRVGRETRYTLQPDPLYAVQRWLAVYERYWDTNLEALREFVETEPRTDG